MKRTIIEFWSKTVSEANDISFKNASDIGIDDSGKIGHRDIGKISEFSASKMVDNGKSIILAEQRAIAVLASLVQCGSTTSKSYEQTLKVAFHCFNDIPLHVHEVP